MVECRAKVSKFCKHWTKESIAQGDGTYDVETNTIVCDSCYITVMMYSPSGKALSHEIEDAIKLAREARDGKTKDQDEADTA